jgi:tryptophan synthase beta chain
VTTRQEERHERAVFGQRDPDPRGYYGPFGGRFVPETLMAPVDELTREYFRVREDPVFLEEFHGLLQHYVGRPTPLYEARRLSAEAGGARIFLKREDLTHTGAHKINNALGQALLARRMGKRRIVAETGAGQHGVATATACALLGLECDVYMGAEDMARQAPNVLRMGLLGATVRQVDAGSRTLKDAINEAMRDWVATVADTYYLLGSVLGPHPYPLMVREFQSIIGREARGQLLAQAGRLPEAVVACVGGGSNAMGIFDAFVADAGVRLIGVEAGGEAIVPGRHAARFAGGSVGILQGTKTWVLQDAHGNIELTHSISAGLDYAAVGPEHAWLQQQGRTEYAYATDAEALTAFQRVAQLEGILPALESSHGVSHAMRVAGDLAPDAIVLVNLSGRGDKDLQTVEKALGATSDEGRVTKDEGRR